MKIFKYAATPGGTVDFDNCCPPLAWTLDLYRKETSNLLFDSISRRVHMPKGSGTVDTTRCTWNSAAPIALKASCRGARQVVETWKKETDGISNVLRPHPGP